MNKGRSKKSSYAITFALATVIEECFGGQEEGRSKKLERLKKNQETRTN
jgi:uncharacterized protein (DUF697 family)